MTETSQQGPNFIGIHVESTEYTVAPGSRIDIPIQIKNLSLEMDLIRLSISGISASWVAASSPVTSLSPGEEKQITLVIQPPHPPQSKVGHIPFTVLLTSQNYPDRKIEARLMLHITAFEVQGRIGVMIGSTQYSVAPGSSSNVNMIIKNQGVTTDEFRLAIEGIPANWISTGSPLTQLAAGEEKEVVLTIRPPITPQSRAGRHKFVIRVISQEIPDQSVDIDCTLTIAAYTHFSCELDPLEIEPDEAAYVRVKNQSNIQQTYSIHFLSQEDALEFNPPLPQRVSIQAGKTSAIEFTAKPRQRPLLGGEFRFPFSASVISAEKKNQIARAELVTKALIPIWVLPVTLVLCLGILCVSLFITNPFNWFKSTSNPSTQTAISAQMTSTFISDALGATQTAIALLPSPTPLDITLTPGDNDSDGDLLPDKTEVEIGTDPNNPDSDGDALTDGQEVLELRTNPLLPDTDGDNLKDGEEIATYKTNPLKPDTEDDGLRDGDEIQKGTDPNNPDTDADDLRDGEEIIIKTDPLKADTDNDRLSDGVEARSCPDPLNPDTDNDGIIDGLDLDPCDPNNPSLTATAVASRPTNTPVPPTQLPPTPTNTNVPTQPPTQAPTIPPGELLPGRIAFESTRDGNSDIYIQDNFINSLTRLTADPATDMQPELSPNGKWIVFVSNRTGNNDIFIMNADGTGQTNITNSQSDDQWPTWAPDSNSIAFQTNRDGNFEIYSMIKDGGNPQNLTNRPDAQDIQPSWFEGRLLLFSTSQSIAFTSNRDGNNEIYIMEPNGANQTNLTNSSQSDDSQPAGAPAGDQIAFTSNRSGNLDIFTMNVDGSAQTNKTNNGAKDELPSWSPDNRYIAFTTDRDANDEIYIMKRDGSGVFNYSKNNTQDRHPTWR